MLLAFDPSNYRLAIKPGGSSSYMARQKVDLFLVTHLVKAHWAVFVSASLFKLAHDLLQFLQPKILGKMIKFVGDPEGYPLFSTGLFYAMC